MIAKILEFLKSIFSLELINKVIVVLQTVTEYLVKIKDWLFQTVRGFFG